MDKSKVGVYGLGVMGRNLALNFNDSGVPTSVFNPKLPGEEHVTDEFLEADASGTGIKGFNEVSNFVDSLERPRKILMMVKAGAPVDSVIGQLTPLLDADDILIDGGNSRYSDTNRRQQTLADKNIRYVGMGVSGGEEGARFGPSLMPGGDAAVWPELQPILQPVAATAPDGTPCCLWMGPQGAGHFVKMVHNGIEYAIMQLLAECYHMMKGPLAMPNNEIGNTFDSWNTSLLSSYLLEITADIFSIKDENQNPVLDTILDSAGQKGTGRWTALTALELGIPLPVISEAVFARTLSSFKDLRTQAEEHFKTATQSKETDQILEQLEDALLGSTLVAFAEGFWLIKAANEEYEWDISPADVANVWRGGCIIRSALLNPIAESYAENPNLPHLLLAPIFQDLIRSLQAGWRSATGIAQRAGIPIPATGAALAHFDGLRTGRLPANLIQAQRDYFGAHTYERVDKPRGNYFHTNW